jgi:tape measure domain-containing protein
VADEQYVIDVTVQAFDKTSEPLEQAQKHVTAFEQSAEHAAKRVQSLSRTPFDLTIRAVDRASAAIDRIVSRGASLARAPITVTIKALDLATAPIRGVMNLLTSYQTYMLGILGAAAGGVAIAWPLKLADNLTSASIGFQAMIGSAQKAQAFIRQMQQFGQQTPFSTNDLIKDAQLLMNSGYQYTQVIPLLRAFGDAVSAGGGDVSKMDNVILALSQMANHGKVDAQDMLQLTSANIPAWRILAQEMHKSVAEVQKLSEAGKIAAGPAIEMLARGLEKQFGGSLVRNANLTVHGILSQFTDAFTNYVATPWGQGLQQGLLPMLTRFNNWLDRNQQLLDRASDALRRWGQEGAEWVAQKVQGLVAQLRTLAESQAWINAPTFWDKLKVGWDNLVVVPFDRWWAGPGKQEVARIAGDIGGFFGSALHGLFATALGIATPSTSTHTVTVDMTPGKYPDILRHLTPEDQQAFMKSYVQQIPTNVFADAGQTAGTAFFNAFAKAFDAKQLANKAVAAFGAVQPWNAQSFGQGAFGTALDLLVGGWALKKGAGLIRGTAQTAKGASDLYGWVRGISTSIRDGSAWSKALDVLKPLGRLAAPLTALAGAYDFITAHTVQGKVAAVGSTVGGVAGVVAGSLIPIPVVGNVIGAWLGSHAGEWLGNKIGSLFSHAGQSQTAAASPTFTTRPSWTGTVPVQQTNNQQQTVTVYPGTYMFNIQVDGGDPEQILSVIQEHGAIIASNLADSVAEEIGKRLERTHANMPARATSPI